MLYLAGKPHVPHKDIISLGITNIVSACRIAHWLYPRSGTSLVHPTMDARHPACLYRQGQSLCRSRFVLARYDGRGTWSDGPGLRCLPIHRPGNLSRFEHPQKSLDPLPLQAMSQDTITGASSIATPTQSQGVVVAACGRGATKSDLEMAQQVDLFVSEARSEHPSAQRDPSRNIDTDIMGHEISYPPGYGAPPILTRVATSEFAIRS